MTEQKKAEKQAFFLSARQEARLMYWRGFTCAEIARRLEVHYNTVRSWFEADKWEKSTIAERVNAQIEVRYAQLIAKEEKSAQDYNEIEQLAKQLERTARLNKYEKTKNEADINPKIEERSKKRKEKQKEKEALGVLSENNIAKLYSYFDKVMYPHQLYWYENRKHTLRQIVKSRQIGATFYFAVEALLEALETGKNQIFLSASRNQANIFRTNIIAFVEQATGVTLKGQNLKLSANTTLYFLSTNSNTAQSYSGDLYVDEYFWIPSFEKIQHVASGMAVHDDRRITYFSTPSTVAHEAYPLWNGEYYNAQRPKKEHIKLKFSKQFQRHLL
ncbi:terminase large subunit domain-containing protein [Histophilus somni]|uniref:terminase large subunit domain-containing protein n=1 Tax=Histophilus somni TaxID=731 RepID=UPI00201FA28D|nr:terminase family protein [Histophilus somni]